jgi:hypothetical protein
MPYAESTCTWLVVYLESGYFEIDKEKVSDDVSCRCSRLFGSNI